MGALRACVDWVQVTFNRATSVQQIVDNFNMKMSDFVEVETGLYGYKKHHRFGHISILSDGAPDMGIHLQMTGNGCREYETYNDMTWQEFVRICFANDGNFTRLDLAIDDIASEDDDLYFKISTLRRKARDGAIRSRFKKAKSIRSIKLSDGSACGETLYFGQQTSDIQIRVYEKDFERLAAGKELDEGVTAWNRIELQTRRDRAQALALYIINSDQVGIVAAGVIRNYVEVCVKSADTNKSRWKVCDWWINFLNDVDKLKLTMIAPDKTVERSMQWIDRSVAPTLAMIFCATDGDTNKIMQYVIDGMDRLTDQQIAIAKQYSDQMHKLKEEEQYYKNMAMQSWYLKTMRTEKITAGETVIGE